MHIGILQVYTNSVYMHGQKNSSRGVPPFFPHDGCCGIHIQTTSLGQYHFTGAIQVLTLSGITMQSKRENAHSFIT